MTKLIFRIDPGDQVSEAFQLQRPLGHYVEIAADRIGEEVLFGYSVVPGIWSVLAVGRFADWRSNDQSVLFGFENVRWLNEPVAIVTEGDPESDRLFAPYLLDTLMDEDLALISAPDLEFVQPATTPMSVAAEGQAAFVSDYVLGAARPGPVTSGFFHSVAEAYNWRCPISGIRQHSLDGRFHEGVAIGIEEPHARRAGLPRDAMFVSSSFGFAYRHGLVVLGEDYDLLRHPDLPAEMRMLLEIANPTAMLRLPGNPAHWPDLDAAGRHRRKFGY